ncbi:MAG: hypothetical protein E6268_09515 [Veillonella sp.]|uniref:hypothetical protein n=1 Tax=Veillonella sp. TaxID=1926307 RepID=UPI00290A9A33|nr:hypothetical protein [Veillonella sp.]MDU5004669.1 hypothetical protein [Veillonella sp.]
MLRKSIIMMALAAAFTMNVNAVQIEVPKWQPPVPGADASIPANAYENYSHINEKAIQEAEIFSAKVQKNVEKPKVAIEKVFKEKTGLAQAVKLGEFSESTVILLHEGKNNIRLSVPNISLRGDTVESKSSDGLLFAVHGYTGILLVGPPHGKKINKYIQNEGIYTYPGLENASWKIFKGKTHVMYTEFTPSKTKTTYGITYLGGGDVKDPYQDKFAEVVMSNYIIPSIEPLSGLDNYSHVKHWDNFSYRIPKKAKLVSEALEDNKNEVRTYEDVGVKIRVLRFRIDPNIVDKSLAKKQIFTFLNKYGDLEAPTQYATVWNNGLPGFLIDRYKPNGESYLRHFTKDSEYYYSYRIDYDESKSLYKHKQLRDMVEYASFDNAESLRKETQWRMSDHHKKKLAANSMFNPWYMEWIRILTQ